MEFYAAIKKNEIMTFAGHWMELEIIVLSEIVGLRSTNIAHSIIYGPGTCIVLLCWSDARMKRKSKTHTEELGSDGQLVRMEPQQQPDQHKHL